MQKSEKKNKKTRYSGIGGQAVLEGVMMKNGQRYAVAVRKPDGDIEVEIDNHQGSSQEKGIGKIPFVRGIFNFIDSMVLGMRALNFSSSFYDEENAPTEGNKAGAGMQMTAKEKASNTIVMVVSFLIAIALFVVLPTFLSTKLEGVIHNKSLLSLAEGALRIVIFLGYIIGISFMKDIRRLYGYHGAEHKCINCIEEGKELNVKNVMSSSRFHRRCGTSFLVFVVFISVVLFFFINVEGFWPRIGLRILMIPVVAGIAYEILRLAGRYDNWFIRVISAPGVWIQGFTTREPDEQMVETAIASVEAVFDWKAYLKERLEEADENSAETIAEDIISDESPADETEADAEADAENTAENEEQATGEEKIDYFDDDDED